MIRHDALYPPPHSQRYRAALAVFSGHTSSSGRLRSRCQIAPRNERTALRRKSRDLAAI